MSQEIADNLQAKLAAVLATWPEGRAKREAVKVHKRAINTALFTMSAEERKFLADEGPEYPAMTAKFPGVDIDAVHGGRMPKTGPTADARLLADLDALVAYTTDKTGKMPMPDVCDIPGTMRRAADALRRYVGVRLPPSDGLELVPAVPTTAMLDAAKSAEPKVGREAARHIYTAMLNCKEFISL